MNNSQAIKRIKAIMDMNLITRSHAPAWERKYLFNLLNLRWIFRNIITCQLAHLLTCWLKGKYSFTQHTLLQLNWRWTIFKMWSKESRLHDYNIESGIIPRLLQFNSLLESGYKSLLKYSYMNFSEPLTPGVTD